ncbi:M14 family metallopeptidase [Poritiphilus flavus]|uniref:DUF2817 domain-containing protein n=1 Tax=Poritiphilus flavus TaxID=2697053 RepID=A0A6L9EH08_9FLAO|nr:M14 metallopeptidase family protein [Poritiphilus flavus]NAS13539.1 DUF2817 domain-containing protein [Poritiphilus flavus]
MDVTALDYASIKEGSVHGRYVTTEHIIPFLDRVSADVRMEEIGRSVEGRPIHLLEIGTGKKKVLMWSQMHGNESTTTKALLDLINYLNQTGLDSASILAECQLLIIPILNPDGAHRYTRLNANEVDLNRDAIDLSQPESRILREVYERVSPDFCFNLHGQRTLFNVGRTELPATVSFLAPASDQDRSITESREISMQLIAAMALKLEELIPGQIGRYDDSFNPNCVGDSFQMLSSPTLLFEAGHYPGDYMREETRKLLFYALVEVLEVIAANRHKDYSEDTYFGIPENNKLFFDILIRNAPLLHPKFADTNSIGIRYEEVLEGRQIQFHPQIAETGILSQHFGHQTYDCSKTLDLDQLKKELDLYNFLI